MPAPRKYPLSPFGERLRAELSARGISRIELLDRLRSIRGSARDRIATATLQRWENGKTTPLVDDVESIALAIGCRFVDLWPSDAGGEPSYPGWVEFRERYADLTEREIGILGALHFGPDYLPPSALYEGLLLALHRGMPPEGLAHSAATMEHGAREADAQGLTGPGQWKSIKKKHG